MGRKQGSEQSHTRDGAIDTLVEQHYVDILYFVASKIGREKAEEVAQSAMLRIIENIRSLKNTDSLKSWMLTIANNECMDYFRKTRRDSRHFVDTDVPEDAAPVEERSLPESMLEREETRQIVLDAIRSLPSNYADCLVLYYHSEETYSSIAKILDISESKVKSDLFRGRQKLKEVLDERLGDSHFYSAAAGLTPLLSTVMAEDAQSLATAERLARCKEYLQEELLINPDVHSMLNPQPTAASKALIGLAVGGVSLALAVGIYLATLPAEVPTPPQTPALVVAAEPPPQPEVPEEPALQTIETVSDMIGTDQAQVLDTYVARGADLASWETFLQAIGAGEADLAADNNYYYTLYLLEKQDKQLLLVAQQSENADRVEVRYQFKVREDLPPMIEMTFLFESNG